MSILATARVEDPRFLTVGGTYTADVTDPILARRLHATFVRSTAAHARLTGVDVLAARAMPGVVAVVTGADIDLDPPAAVVPMRSEGHGAPAPRHRQGALRRRADRRGAHRARPRAGGQDAAEATCGDRLRPAAGGGRPRARPPQDEVAALPRGRHQHRPAGSGWTRSSATRLFDGCEVVVSRSEIVNQRVAGVPLEARAAAAVWSPGDGRVHQWLLHPERPGRAGRASPAAGEAVEAVRVRRPRRGRPGSDRRSAPTRRSCSCRGWPLTPSRPVRWDETRSENMLGLGHGRAQVQLVAIGGTRDGTVLAYRLTCSRRTPAPTRASGRRPAEVDPDDGGRRLRHPERVVTLRRSSPTRPRPAPTAAPAGPRPRAAIERAMDLFAAEIGMDLGRGAVPQPDPPVRGAARRPAAPPPTTPATTRRRWTRCSRPATTTPCGPSRPRARPGGDTVRHGHRRVVLRRDHRRARRRARSTPRSTWHADGIGHRVHRHVAARPGPPHRVRHDRQRRASASRSSGSPWCTATPTSWPSGTGTMGSRSLQPGGAAVLQGADELSPTQARTARRRAAGGRGRRRRARPSTAARSTSPACRRSGSRGPTWPRRRRRVAVGRRQPASTPDATYPFGAHVAVVEVDTETGQVRLRAAASPATTPGGSSTRCSPTASATAASPRAPPRRCCEEVALRRRRQPAHVQPRRLRRSSAPPSCRRFELVEHWRRRRG